jgi:ribonuclease BN (tRNA processing enzyme)
MTLDTGSTLRTHTFATRSSLTVTLLGTGSPMPAPDRAGPSTLISSGEGGQAEHYLIDAGRGVLMRMAALGLGAPNLTVIRKDIIANLPMQRIKDTLDYHSSPEEAAQTATRNNVATLILTHYVPPIPVSGTHADWRNLAATHFTGTIEVGDDLHKIVIEG